MEYVDEPRGIRADLITASLVLARELSDSGDRTDLDDLITAFGFDRTELGDEVSAEMAGDRESDAATGGHD